MKENIKHKFYPVFEALYLSDLNIKYVPADLISQKATNQKFTTPISAFVWNWHPADKTLYLFSSFLFNL